MTDVIHLLQETRDWIFLKEVLLEALLDRRAQYASNMEEYRDLDRQMLLVINHWEHVPRTAETSALEQQLKVANREVEQRGTEIKRLKAIIEEWRITHKGKWE